MKKWNFKCPKCNSEKVYEKLVACDYYDKTFSHYFCDECNTEIVVKLIPMIFKIKNKNYKELE